MSNAPRAKPNLHVFNVSLHLDEACPHLHIDFIPFYTKERQRGLKKGVSMRAALIEQGFSPKPGRNQLEQWEESERDHLIHSPSSIFPHHSPHNSPNPANTTQGRPLQI